jgi:hypothetical protein
MCVCESVYVFRKRMDIATYVVFFTHLYYKALTIPCL